MNNPIIDLCDCGHKFAKLDDHPEEEGYARCPRCLAIGWEVFRNRFERAERSLLRAGFTDHGSEEWKPPLGKAALWRKKCDGRIQPDNPGICGNCYSDMCADYEKLKRDAERYRWLRKRCWNDSYMFVIKGSKDVVLLEAECPSRERLDEIIDNAMEEEKE